MNEKKMKKDALKLLIEIFNKPMSNNNKQG